MKPGQVFVRAQRPNGRWESVDVLDLDDESFRAFVIDHMAVNGLVFGLKPESIEGEHITYRTKE